mgnify:CR=1 FL=1
MNNFHGGPGGPFPGPGFGPGFGPAPGPGFGPAPGPGFGPAPGPGFGPAGRAECLAQRSTGPSLPPVRCQEVVSCQIAPYYVKCSP